MPKRQKRRQSKSKMLMDSKELIEEMEAHLPIPARPSRELFDLLRDKGKDITLNTELNITKVYDSGDMGGIMCPIIEEDGEVYIVSLTHLRIKSDHPLYYKIYTY